MRPGSQSDSEELTFFAYLASHTGGPILDLACGTGRLAISLAARGYAVTGVDLSAETLAAAAVQPGGGVVEWVRGDARELCRSDAFGLVLMAGSAFEGQSSVEDQMAVVVNAFCNLKPGGAVRRRDAKAPY